MRRRSLVILISACALVAVAGIAAAVVGPKVIGRNSNAVNVLPKASCGSATTHGVDGNTTIISADAGALTCFDAAARDCRAGSIQIVAEGVDTGVTYVFTIEPGGAGCQLTELSQGYSANFGGTESQVSSVHCSGLSVAGAGVKAACGGQEVLIPAA